ncbi:hypothetical protein LEMA_P120610.1 [Plenodomus lingam JN3]|uniref:Heterokaryon incompatibility domain-containing protein n=1 Tax=Leptosphaeria maculans (strain JN3 / isolate v23.1.3 / race Av1-4-5-6-7-8) TaxID=985895 RepID=E4ZSY2_LEPMJ|nr:hypothetical protein LEMA_P120610.1 [Plenodomus lingam JN3]CBX94570.1 hypothetical protein LEMA_P120610.1 [Plenodomus lingam JN3]
MEADPRPHEKPLQLHYPSKNLSNFRHRPLNHAGGENVRLVCLLPGDFTDQIFCELFHASLEFGIDYEAVSYTWATEDGDASLSESIACGYVGEENETKLSITVNCASALRRLRHRSEPRVLWIDIIAIDQANPEERNHQVGLMGQIYSQASQVLVYLGEEDLGFGVQGIWQDSERRLVALKKLFAKRWASRVWVIQEVALAQKLKMITGDVAIPMDAQFMTRVRGRARVSQLLVPGPLAWDPVVSAPSRDLLTMLHMSRNCLSTDPRDKVYGLLGLAGERLQNLVQVDYSQSVEEVLTIASMAIIFLRKDFEILAYATSTLGATHANGRLPTWVPNWSEYRDEEAAVQQFNGWRVGPWRSLSKEWLWKRLEDEERLDWLNVVTMPTNWYGSAKKPYLTLRAHCIGVIDDTIRESHGGPISSSRHGLPTYDYRLRLQTLIERDIPTDHWPPQFRWLIEGLSTERKLFQGRSERPIVGRLTESEKADLQSFCDHLARL